MDALIVGIITFVVGNISGWYLHKYFHKTLMLSEDNSKNILLLAVTVVWVISMLISFVNPTYQVPVPVHGIMGIIVGFFFYKSDALKK